MSNKRKGSVSKEKETTKEAKEVWVCEVCRKDFKDDTSRILECERCEVHQCAKCLQIEDELYDKLMQRKDFHWYCGGCESKVMQSIQLEKEIERKLVDFMGKVEYKMKTLEGSVYKKLAEMEEKMNEKLKDHVTHRVVDEALQKVNEKAMSYADKARQEIKEDLKTEITQNMKENIKTEITGDLKEAQTVLQETRKQVKEQLDKEARRNNVIIYRAPESTKATVEERTKDDRDYVLELMNDILEVDCRIEDIKRMFRMGLRGEHVRPLLIEFKTREVKNLVMESAGRLYRAPEKFQGISVTHDMTPAEREQCKQTVADAKAKTAADTSGEWKFLVRGPPGEMKVIRVRKRPQY